MRVDIITLFPRVLEEVFSFSIIGRARKRGLLKIKIHNLRDWAVDRRGTVDDKPFGGGPGMLLRPEPIFAALESVRRQGGGRSILLTAKGKRLRQKKVESLARLKQITIFCGHYEGVDERVRDLFDEEISLGDFVLTGGELAGAVLVDAVTRLLPKVLGKDQSSQEESFAMLKREGRKGRYLEYPQYTQPRDWKGKKVPAVLLSGNHEEIKRWREKNLKKVN